ncbi:MAG: alpha/beta fold hydrolase, partial [Roseiflexus sp.]|nr:alpha/beta fold hydrolase [Roseiflexus sp.]
MNHSFQSSLSPASLDIRSRSFAVFTGATGVLLIHGFGGDPAEVLPLAAALIQDGYSVYAPLLPGHGTLPDAMAGVQWQQWAEAAAHGFAALRQRCDNVVIVGFSMGGLLALILAAHLPVARLAVLAPALRLR